MELFNNSYFIIIVLVVASYLVGSISFSLIMSKIFSLGNLRKIGSGNLGASNVLRTGNYLAAALTLVFDLAKGLIPVIFARLVELDSWAIQLVGFVSFIGHLWPIWHQFSGGKGVATFYGIILGCTTLAGILTAIVWLIVAGIFRITSIAALVSVIVYPVILIAFGLSNYLLFSAVIAVLVWYKHRSNISRILEGNESKIKF